MRNETRINELDRLSKLAKMDYFWRDQKPSNLGNIIGILRDMAGQIWGSDNESNPYYVMLRGINHDFCCLLRNLNIDYSEYEDPEIFKNITKVFKSYIQNVDGLVSGVFNTHQIIDGYLYSKGTKMIKFYSIFNDKDKVYKCVNVLNTPEQFEHVKSLLDKYKSKTNNYYSKEWIDQCLSDIENCSRIIGWQWYINF